MTQGDKSAYTDKQKRKAEHIAEGYEARGVPEQEAEARAWATVNKDDGGGKKSGSGRVGALRPAIPPPIAAASSADKRRRRDRPPTGRRPRKRRR